LRSLKGKVSELYCTKGAKKKINPNRKSKIYLLATNGKNEAKTTEAKDALLDFFGQLGQRQGDYIRRLLIAGGDGATFDMMVQLKVYLQFHEDDFESFALLVPLLELWHLAWTDLTRLYKAHWGEKLSSDDPGTLRIVPLRSGEKSLQN
jgi:hypothetical protein